MIRGLKILAGAGVLALSAIAAAADDKAAPPAAVARDTNGPENIASDALQTGNLTPEARVQVLVARGRARCDFGRYEDAIADFTAALDSNAPQQPANRARIYFARGVAYDEISRSDEAVADYSSALAIVPDFAAALNNRGNAFRRAGRAEDARRDYTASLAAGNAHPEYSQYGLGQLAEADGDTVTAGDWYRKALVANPKYTLASQRLAAIANMSTSAKAVAPVPAIRESEAATRTPPIVVLPVKSAEGANPAAIVPAAYAPPGDGLSLRPAIVEAIDDMPARRAKISGTGLIVQLGAWKAETDAAEGWNKLTRQAGSLLKGLTPEIIAADVPGKGRFWRLRTAPQDGETAASLCGKLSGQGIPCMPVK